MPGSPSARSLALVLTSSCTTDISCRTVEQDHFTQDRSAPELKVISKLISAFLSSYSGG